MNRKGIISFILAAIILLSCFTSCTISSGINLWQTKVPDTVGKSHSDALEMLNEKKLHGLITDKVTDTKAEENSVITQTPEKDEIVSKGSIVDLVLSAGKGEVYVPNLSYYEEDTAKEILESMGLKTKTVSSDASDNKNVAPGAVCWSVPDPGETLADGDTVTLRVRNNKPEDTDAGNQVSVPDMVGKDFYEMIKALEENNLFIYITGTEYGNEAEENKILTQETAAGTKVAEGTAIGVTVCEGKGNIHVPDITYVKEERAVEMIENLGLKPEITYEESETVAKGTVIEQKIDKGDEVNGGSEISLVVSSGYTVEVPDVVGMTEAAAFDTLIESGLSINAVTAKDDSIEIGSVISQDVAAGSKVQLGTLVTIVVSGDKDEKNAEDSDSEKSTEKVNYLTPNEADFENLGTLLTKIGSYRMHEASDDKQKVDYYYKNSDAYEYACEGMFSPDMSSIFGYMNGMYGWNNSYETDYRMYDANYNKQTVDPLNRFDNPEVISVFDGKKTDSVFKNFFNVTPNHEDYYESYYSYDGQQERYLRAYYYENNYYVSRQDTGGNPSGNIFVKEYTLKNDGTYEIIASGYMLGSNEFVRNYIVTAGLKDVDGDRMWSIFKIEATKKEATTTTKTTTTTTTTTTKASNSQFLEATQSDFDNLISKYCDWIPFQSFDYSNCSAKDALEKVIMPEIMSFGLYNFYYGSDSSNLIHSYNPEQDTVPPPKDPKNRVANNWDDAFNGNGWWMYTKLDAQKVDWLMKNILNVTPNHNYTSEESYYYDGYYYVHTGEGGDGCLEPIITSNERLNDGKYKLTLKYSDSCTAKITVALKNLNNKREWSFYSISVS